MIYQEQNLRSQQHISWKYWKYWKISGKNFILQTTDIKGVTQSIAFARFMNLTLQWINFYIVMSYPIIQLKDIFDEVIVIYKKSAFNGNQVLVFAVTMLQLWRIQRFVVQVKELYVNILVFHWFLFRSSYYKTSTSENKNSSGIICKKVIFFRIETIEKLPINLYQEMETKYESFILHTKLRWFVQRKRFISRACI